MGVPSYCNGHLMTSVPGGTIWKLNRANLDMLVFRNNNTTRHFGTKSNCNYLDGTVKECVMFPTGDKREKCKKNILQKKID